MRRVYYAFTVCILVLLYVNGLCFAESNIVESPDIKVVIDGTKGTYTDVPIIVGGRTLLPLRALLSNLGVQNDDKHIVWNSHERSVTVLNGDTTIYLKVDSNSALVNGLEEKLDAVPINYKNRIYIPARFIAQSLGKKVVWDNHNNSVYICDEANFNKVKELLDKALSAMNSIEKVKIEIESVTKSTYLDNGWIHTASNVILRDNKDKIIKSDFQSQLNENNEKSVNEKLNNYESYYLKNTSYSCDKESKRWDKKTLSEKEFDKLISSIDTQNIINPHDATYAGLLIDYANNSSTIVLKGSVCAFTEIMENNESFINLKGDVLDTFLEIYIDKNSNYITKINSKFDGYILSEQSERFRLQVENNCNYSEVNGDFTLDLPEFVLRDQNSEEPETKLDSEERVIVDRLKTLYINEPIDGMYSNAYGLGKSEAMLFIILEDKVNLDSFTGLSDMAKKVFIKECVEDNIEEYFGCEDISTIVIFDRRRYAQMDMQYKAPINDVNLINYDGGVLYDVFIQDRENNTYTKYYAN